MYRTGYNSTVQVYRISYLSSTVYFSTDVITVKYRCSESGITVQLYRAAYNSTEYQVYRTAYNSTVQLFRTGLVQYSCSEQVITDLREADPVRVMRDPREDARETSLKMEKCTV